MTSSHFISCAWQILAKRRCFNSADCRWESRCVISPAPCRAAAQLPLRQLLSRIEPGMGTVWGPLGCFQHLFPTDWFPAGYCSELTCAAGHVSSSGTGAGLWSKVPDQGSSHLQVALTWQQLGQCHEPRKKQRLQNALRQSPPSLQPHNPHPHSYSPQLLVPKTLVLPVSGTQLPSPGPQPRQQLG